MESHNRHIKIKASINKAIGTHPEEKKRYGEGKYAVEKLFRKGDEMTEKVQIPAGNDVILWGHWDLAHLYLPIPSVVNL